MNLNWLSPLPPARTDVAHFTSRILPALRSRAEVRLWTEVDQWDTTVLPVCPILPLPPGATPWSKLQDADLTVYNIGNNSDFHAALWRTSCVLPGVIVLHDVCLQHLFAGYYLGQKHDAAAWLMHMVRYYGQTGYEVGRLYLEGGCSTEALGLEYPLTPLATDDALGVLVHTRAAFETLSATVPCPVSFAPLPYPATQGDELARWEQVRAAKPAGPPYRLALFGYIGPNRRLEQVLEALAGLPQRQQFRLNIYGTLWDLDLVGRWVESRGLTQLVKFHGFINDLDLALAGADLVLNLRYPTMGEASGTQLRIWDHALPSLVTRTGWYGSLPADTVLFVRPQYEIEDIREHLQGFIENPERYRAIGRNGRRCLEQQHCPESYVAALMALTAEALAFQPRLAALKLADRAAGELRNWTSAASGADLASESLARTIGKMLCREAGPAQSAPKPVLRSVSVASPH